MPLKKLTTVDREITARCIYILNHANPDIYQFMQHTSTLVVPPLENHTLAKKIWSTTCQELSQVMFPAAPNVEINKRGAIITTEAVCEGFRKLEVYVEASQHNIDRRPPALLQDLTLLRTSPGVLNCNSVDLRMFPYREPTKLDQVDAQIRRLLQDTKSWESTLLVSYRGFSEQQRDDV